MREAAGITAVKPTNTDRRSDGDEIALLSSCLNADFTLRSTWVQIASRKAVVCFDVAVRLWKKLSRARFPQSTTGRGTRERMGRKALMLPQMLLQKPKEGQLKTAPLQRPKIA
jgi:hypothetical protein